MKIKEIFERNSVKAEVPKKLEGKKDRSLKGRTLAGLTAGLLTVLGLQAHSNAKAIEDNMDRAEKDLKANPIEAVQYAVQSKLSLDTKETVKSITKRRITEIAEDCNKNETYDLKLTERIREESDYEILDPKLSGFVDHLTKDENEKTQIKNLIISEQKRIKINIQFESDQPNYGKSKMRIEEFTKKLKIITNAFHSQDVTKYLNAIVIRIYAKGSSYGGEYKNDVENTNKTIHININQSADRFFNDQNFLSIISHEIGHIGTNTLIGYKNGLIEYKYNGSSICILYNKLLNQDINHQEAIKIIHEFIHNGDKEAEITKNVLDSINNDKARYPLNDSLAFRSGIDDIIKKTFPEVTKQIRNYSYGAAIGVLAENVRFRVKGILETSGYPVYKDGIVNVTNIPSHIDPLDTVNKNYEFETSFMEGLSEVVYPEEHLDSRLKKQGGIEEMKNFVLASMIAASKFNNQAYLDVEYMSLRNTFNENHDEYISSRDEIYLKEMTKISNEMNKYLQNNKKPFDIAFYLENSNLQDPNSIVQQLIKKEQIRKAVQTKERSDSLP